MSASKLASTAVNLPQKLTEHTPEFVVLCTLRFELVDWSAKPDINFIAKGHPAAKEFTREQVEQFNMDADEIRGCRQISDIQIETLHPALRTLEDGETRESDNSLAVEQSSNATYAAVVAGGSKPVASGSQNDCPSSASASAHRLPSTIEFTCGNPAVEQVQGILHLYKDGTKVSMTDDANRSELICMLSVPVSHTVRDLLYFTEHVAEGIEHIKVIKDHSPVYYMVLIKFKSQKQADEFYINYNNTPFNSIETHVCHLVYVARVDSVKMADGGAMPIPGLVELPNCPVCLERMDESVDGILTILCNHAFHTKCLVEWEDTSCPVCRFTQTPETSSEHYCFECKSTESLWICLICGQVGCGRYVDGHAYQHFVRTQHTYALQLSSGRVWDYAGDNYVHRLVQNKEDGKLVETNENGDTVSMEKMDSLNLEYTHLLTNQLDSQRKYFEQMIEELTQNSEQSIRELEDKLSNQWVNVESEQETLARLTQDKVHAEKKCVQISQKLKDVLRKLQDEQVMNKSLLANQTEWALKVQMLEERKQSLMQELKDKEEQLRDIMFHVDAQNKLLQYEEVSKEEVEQGHVTVGASAPIRRRRNKK